MPQRLIEHGVTDSTSERAFEALRTGTARHGDVHSATGQTAGRGQRGRVWYSPEGEGVYLSLILLPPPAPLSPAALTMAAGLAVLDATRALGVEGARLEWPNDAVKDGAKFAGVLIETRGLDHGKPHYVVGVGLNVLQGSFPEDLRAEREVTSLRRMGCGADLEEARDALVDALPPRLDQAQDHCNEVFACFLEATGLEGRSVRAVGPDGSVAGTVLGLTPAEGLKLTRPDGSVATIPVEHVRSLEDVG